MLAGYLGTAGSKMFLGTVAAFALGLSACGGGSSYGSSSTPLAPAAGDQSASSTAAASPTAAANAAVKITDAGNLGKVLTDPKGMTLYIRKSDPVGGSTCTGQCATTWPPLASTVASPAKPDGLAGDLSTFSRDNGTKQTTYNGQALYTFAGDKAPGDVTGQGVGGVWFAASAQSGSATTTAATTPDYSSSDSSTAQSSATPSTGTVQPLAAATTAPAAPAQVATATQAPASVDTPTPAPIPAPVATPTPVPPTAAPPIATPSTPVVTTPIPPSPTPTAYAYPYPY